MFQWLEEKMRKRLNNKGYHSVWKETSVGKIHVFVKEGRGKLPPLLLFHGLASSSLTYSVMFSDFQQHFSQIIAVDMLGHGFSGIPKQKLTSQLIKTALSESLEGIVQEPMLVVGNSMGGAAAIRFALEAPEKVLGLYLLSPAGAKITEEEMKRLLQPFRLQNKQEAKIFLTKLYHRVPPWIPFLVGNEIVRRFQTAHIQQLKDSFHPEDMFSPEELETLKMPIVFFWGKSERLLSPENFAYFQEHLPKHAKIFNPEGFGHSPHLDNPKQLSQWIVDFAKTL